MKIRSGGKSFILDNSTKLRGWPNSEVKNSFTALYKSLFTFEMFTMSDGFSTNDTISTMSSLGRLVMVSRLFCGTFTFPLFQPELKASFHVGKGFIAG